MFNLPKSVVMGSSPSSSCVTSVLNDPCKQSYLQQKLINNKCNNPNWKTNTTHDPKLLNNPMFNKGLSTCHNL